MLSHQEQYAQATQNYRSIWEKKTTKQIQKEIESWHRYIDRYSQSYAWHGKDITPPGTLADGDKVLILKEILRDRNLNK